MHYYGEVPVIIYLNNEEMKGDFENVISIVDSYDKSQADSANDFEYFTDAYLVLKDITVWKMKIRTMIQSETTLIKI